MKDTVPAYLAGLKQWHHWQFVDGSKIPYQIGDSRAKSNDAATWSTLDEACDTLRDDRQLAFELGQSGLIGLDFDDCFDSSGDLMPWAEEIIDAIRCHAYCEHSPSGNGLKAIVFGVKPDSIRSRFPMADGSKLEVFGHGRFWAWTGQVVFDNLPSSPTDIASAVSETLLRLQGEWNANNQPKPVRSRSVQPDGMPAIRASAYAAKLDIQQGDRNNTLYHLTHKCRSFGCDESEAKNIVFGWNMSLANPLDEHELRATFGSAWGGTPYSPAEDRQMSDVDDSSGMTIDERREAWAEKRRAEADKRQPVDYSDVIEGSGFVDLIVGLAMSKTEEQHPEYGLSAAMTLLSLCAGQRYYTKMRHSTNGNTYIATIGHSGSGKETVRDVVAEFIDMAGLSDQLQRAENVQGYKQLAVWVSLNPNCHLMLDEYAETLSKMTGDRASQALSVLAATLKSAYTASGKVWNPSSSFGENSIGPIEYPSVNINATMTPGGFESCISEQAVETGLIGRFMVFCAERRPAIEHEVPDDMPTSDQYIESNHAAFDRATKLFFDMAGPVASTYPALPDKEQLAKDAQEAGICLESMGYHVSHDEMVVALGQLAKKQSAGPAVDRVRIEIMPDAEKRLSDHFRAIAERNRDEREGVQGLSRTVVWSRAPEKTAKFAMLFAISRYLVSSGEELRVEISDAERAISLNNKIARRLTALIEDSAASEHSKLVERIISFVDASPGKTASHSKIITLTRTVPPFTRDAAIQDARNSGLIALSKDGKGYTTDVTAD